MSGRPSKREVAIGKHSVDALVIDVFPVISGVTGEVEAAVQLERVVTEERRLQARLIQQDRLAGLGQLAAGFAHEIGNPLSSISSELQMMELYPDPDTLKDSLRVVRDHVDRVARLLHQLNELGPRPTQVDETLDVSAVVASVLHLLRNDRRSRLVTVRSQLATDAVIWGNRDLVTQCVLNLCLNALEAMPDGGQLDVETRVDGDRILLAVTDTGDGIPDDVLPNIFEPFFTTKAPGKGSGLGLFVTNRIVTDLGGRIDVASVPSGGTRFVVTVPRLDKGPDSDDT
jgi:signal transduction histidine kinase